MSRLVPVAVVMKEDDLEFLSAIVDNLPPLLTPIQKHLYGWTDDAIGLGRVVGAFCDLLRSGDIEVEVPR